MRIRVVLVDDESRGLAGLDRVLSRRRPDWEIYLCHHGNEAIELLATTEIDVLVSPTHMPGVHHGDLLTRIATLYPHCIRLGLSGRSEREQSFCEKGPAHQCLPVPCDPEYLLQTIERACGKFSHLHDKTLQEIVSRIDDSAPDRFLMKIEIEQGYEAGCLAQRIAELHNAAPEVIQDAFLAGSLRDIGLRILADHLPDRFQETATLCEQTGQPLWRVEMAVLGTTHAAIGAHLLSLWGLSTSVVEAVALHHQPSLTSDERFSALTAVHVADALIEDHRNPFVYRTETTWDEDYLDNIRCSHLVKECQAIWSPMETVG